MLAKSWRIAPGVLQGPSRAARTPHKACYGLYVSAQPIIGPGSLPLAGRAARRRSCCAPRASPSDSEFEGVAPGDAQLQEALEEQLRLQLKSEVIKESIREDLRSKVEDLKAISEELHAQLDEGYRIERFRNDLESQEALASAMEKFNELEDEIAAMKEQIKADRRELKEWERASAAARSKGLFFQNLYTPPRDDDDEEGAAAGGPQVSRFAGEVRGSLDPEAAAAARAAAAKIIAPAEEEVGSPLRLWLFGYMAAVLALVVGQDLTTASPSLGLDALYGVLGVVLGINAWNERQRLTSLASRQTGGSGGGSGGAASADERKP